MIGAGQGGLGAAKVISELGVDVVVLEKGRIGETWLSQRWDSFSLNTPNWMNGLPGSPYPGDDPDGFMTHTELVDYFNEYVKEFDIDVRTGVNVTRVAPSNGDGRFVIETDSESGREQLECSQVVVASGIANSPHVPSVAAEFPEKIVQISTGTYRSPEHLR
ncbi:MAG: hypothetical protein DWQ40_10850, partial [Actinobacteria bacterium]